MTGIELIAKERQRQIEQEGWTAEHDSQHTAGELLQCACYYFPGQVGYQVAETPQTQPTTTTSNSRCFNCG